MKFVVIHVFLFQSIDRNKDIFGMAIGFFKAVNLVLFLRSDWRLFIVYFVFCIGKIDFSSACFLSPALITCTNLQVHSNVIVLFQFFLWPCLSLCTLDLILFNFLVLLPSRYLTCTHLLKGWLLGRVATYPALKLSLI